LGGVEKVNKIIAFPRPIYYIINRNRRARRNFYIWGAERKIMIIYPDTCIYGRPFDAPPNAKTRAEAKAIKTILKKCKTGGHRIIGSEALIAEFVDIADDAKRNNIEAFYYTTITDEVENTDNCRNRAATLTTAANLGKMDAAHLAIAEAAGADFLLTVDKAFIKKCNILNLTAVKVMNPTIFVNGGYLK
jgi:predicted nucleic acid-binding protein